MPEVPVDGHRRGAQQGGPCGDLQMGGLVAQHHRDPVAGLDSRVLEPGGDPCRTVEEGRVVAFMARAADRRGTGDGWGDGFHGASSEWRPDRSLNRQVRWFSRALTLRQGAVAVGHAHLGHPVPTLT